MTPGSPIHPSLAMNIHDFSVVGRVKIDGRYTSVKQHRNGAFWRIKHLTIRADSFDQAVERYEQQRTGREQRYEPIKEAA